MEKQQILRSDLLDILFDGKNKAYGAYDLRKSYRQRLKYAIIGTMSIVAIFIAAVLVGQRTDKNIRPEKIIDFTLSNFKDEPKPVEPPPVKQQQQPPLQTVAVTPPKIVRDAEVTEEDEVKSIDQIEDTRIGSFNQEGVKDEGIVAPPIENNTGVTTTLVKEPDYGALFYTVQMQAEFPGGAAGWTNYLRRNLNSSLPVDNGAPAGKYTVIVSFTVDKTGVISDVVAENDPGYGTKAEAVRVIAKGPNWKPAEQNGRKVIYRHKQSITFLVAED